MKQVREHVSVPLKELPALLAEVGECKALSVRMYSTYKHEWLVDIILLQEIPIFQ